MADTATDILALRSNLWQHGPAFLLEDEDSWPAVMYPTSIDPEDPEVKLDVVMMASSAPSEPAWLTQQIEDKSEWASKVKLVSTLKIS